MSAPCPALGFVVTMRPVTVDADLDVIVDDFLDHVESHDLQTAGSGEAVLSFVVRREGSQATDADRASIREWSARWSTLAAIEIGDIVDLGDD
jgi:uncharacterized protein YggL (DUF469 family)